MTDLSTNTWDRRQDLQGQDRTSSSNIHQVEKAKAFFLWERKGYVGEEMVFTTPNCRYLVEMHEVRL